MQAMLACFDTFSAYRARDTWTRRRRRWRGRIRFRRGMFRIAIANPGLTLNRFEAFLKSCKGAVWSPAGEIRTPGIVLRVSAVESGPANNRDRDQQAPRHPGSRLRREIILSRGLIVPKERAMQVCEEMLREIEGTP